MISIIDYDAGNLKSVEKAFASLGYECEVTRDRHRILASDGVILPGVGSFGMAMDQLKKYELDKVISDVADAHIPLLGICLGLQLLFAGSDESEGVEGLGLLPGKILRIPDAPGLKIPHIGWNDLTFHGEGQLFKGIGDSPYVYFVHSYYLRADDRSIVTATTEYGVTIDASVESGTIYACQFHPEKSGNVGLAMLKNFGGLCEG